jgi:SAM-dependent methyltransferase
LLDSGDSVRKDREPYDGYAEIYDRTGQGRFGLRMLLWARDYWAGAWPESVVDVACGTGQVAVALSLRDVRTAGVDRSDAMLARAADRAHRAGVDVPWVRADLADCPDVPGMPFDAATCFYDALNTCLTETGLERCLASVARLVRPGGELVMDMITDHGIREVWGRGVELRESAGILGVWRSAWHAARRVGTLDLTYFVRSPDASWERFDEHHEHRGWDPVEVGAALAATGWELVSLTDGLSLEPPAADSYRVVYVARRRGP